MTTPESHLEDQLIEKLRGLKCEYRPDIVEITEAIDAMQRDGCGLIIFQAAADPWVHDPLGGYQTARELKERDVLVFESCKRRRLPIVWNLSGGYAKDAAGSITPVIELHRTTMIEGLRIFPVGTGVGIKVVHSLGEFHQR